MERVGAVFREYRVAGIADGRLAAALAEDPGLLRRVDLEQRDADGFRDNLEAAYLARLFAVFESALRAFWWDNIRQTKPDAGPLMHALASRLKMPTDVFDDADAVREYRNWLVHENRGEIADVDLSDARRRLCRYLAVLPKGW